MNDWDDFISFYKNDKEINWKNNANVKKHDELKK